jgi:hypothetical protein
VFKHDSEADDLGREAMAVAERAHANTLSDMPLASDQAPVTMPTGEIEPCSAGANLRRVISETSRVVGVRAQYRVLAKNHECLMVFDHLRR